MKIVGTASIFNENNEILIGQRPEGKDLAGLWEFPGGKLEEGETIEQCIIREINEELCVQCIVGKFLMEVVKEYKHGEFKLEVYEAKLKDKENLKPMVHQNVKWVRVDELDDYEFPPADIDIIEYLKEKF